MIETLEPNHKVIHFDNVPELDGWHDEKITPAKAISILNDHGHGHEIINGDLYVIEHCAYNDGKETKQPIKIEGCTYGDLYAWMGY